MLTELLSNVNSDIARGMAQAAGAIVLCLAVVGLCRQFAVHVERETAISIARGLVQMVFVGIVLAALLHGSLLVGAMILLAMTFAAAVTASNQLGVTPIRRDIHATRPSAPAKCSAETGFSSMAIRSVTSVRCGLV